MKKFLCFALAAIMLVFSVSCFGSSDTPAETTPPSSTTPPTQSGYPLAVGYGRVAITPDKSLLPIHLNESKTATNVYNDICATTVAVTDLDVTLLFITLDLRALDDELYHRVANAVSEETGIEKENIMISTTHNHSAPDVDMYWDTTTAKYETFLVETIPQSAVMAMEDFAPATMSSAKGDTTGLNFVRRYILSNGGIGTVRPYWDRNETPAVSHESEADTELQTLYFDRDGADDVVMVNWQCHPAAMSPAGTISADWVHDLRTSLEDKDGVLVAFFQGAAGNINQYSEFRDEMKFPTMGDPALTRAVGLELAKIVRGSFKNLTPVESGPIKVKYDKNIIRDKGGWNKDVNLYFAAIGEFALVSNPFEMFHQYGEKVKDESPYSMTFYVGYANGYHFYMPTVDAYERGGYEAVTCNFDKNTGNVITERMLDVLNELYNE